MDYTTLYTSSITIQWIPTICPLYTTDFKRLHPIKTFRTDSYFSDIADYSESLVKVYTKPQLRQGFKDILEIIILISQQKHIV